MIRVLICFWGILVILVNEISPIDVTSSIEFDPTFIGVVFSPYVRNRWPNGTMPKWKTYTFQEVSTLLDLASTKFHHLSIYGMGVGDPDVTWRESDPVAAAAFAAAEHNSKLNQNRRLSLSLGVYHNEDSRLTSREALNAFEAAEEANQLFPNTVWGIALSSFGWMGYRTWNDTIRFLETYQGQSHQAKLKLGVRLEVCDQIIPRKRPEDQERLHSAPVNTAPKPLSEIQRIARGADFLICNTFPASNMASKGVEATAKALIVQMLSIVKGLRAENAGIEVWFETGWPSAGISRFGSTNTGRNLRTFWSRLTQLATESKLNVYMLEAFDQPWKLSNEKDQTEADGPNGAESHFGWWRLVDNKNLSSFEEKIAEPVVESVLEGGMGAATTAGIVVAILIPIIVFLAWRLFKARQTIERISEKDIKEFMDGIPGSGKEDSVDAALQLPYDRSYELSKTDFVVDESDVLGSGAFGVVHKGRIIGLEGTVAFKRPNKDVSVSQLKNLLSEIKIMIYIGKHENIVVLLGAYTEHIRDGTVYIASECCSLGSLESHLRNIPKTFISMTYENIAPNGQDQVQSVDVRYVNPSRKPIENTTAIPVLSLYKWSFQVASGMEYLANKKVIHADLATRNVLLTEDGTAKISDFGLSRRLYEYTQYVKCSQEPLPWRWMAIESLRNLTFSSMSDVWSFGVTLWEIFSLGDMPYPGLSWNITFVEDLEQGLRMQLPKYATPAVYERMVQCWNLDPKTRPSFTTLKDYFESLVCEEQKLNC